MTDTERTVIVRRVSVRQRECGVRGGKSRWDSEGRFAARESCMSDQIQVTPAALETLASSYSSAAGRVRELLGSLTPAASAAGSAFGSATADTTYTNQWNQIRSALEGIANGMDQFSKALYGSAGAYASTDAHAGGH